MSEGPTIPADQLGLYQKVAEIGVKIDLVLQRTETLAIEAQTGRAWVLKLENNRTIEKANAADQQISNLKFLGIVIGGLLTFAGALIGVLLFIRAVWP